MPSSKSSSSSSSERNFSDDAWNNHLEPAGSSLLIAAGVFILLSIATTSLCLAAHFTDDFQRIDEYNPKFLTLSQRYFDGVKDPFIIWDRNNNNTCSFLTMLREAGNLTAWQAAERAQGRPIITYPFCSFHIPYTAIWGAMASSLFGLAAVCFYAMNVMSKPRGTDEMHDIANKIHISALEFLNQEYTWLAPFVFLLFCFLLIAIDGQDNSWVPASSVSFLFGAFLSASCGYMGMHLATQGNCRTAAACFSSKDQGLEEGLAVAFRTGACMGIGVVSCGVLGLTLSYAIFGNVQSLGGFGFGASAVALFARVGGGIYTKAADVGADLCGKVDHSLAEDSPKNPATIADCVGDNVGDVAGMGADLFESYVGSIVAAAVLGAGEFGEKGVALPFYIAMIGLVVSVFGTLGIRVSKGANGKATLDQLLAAMRLNIIVSGLFIVAGCVILCVFLFRAERDELEDLFDTPWRQKEPGARLLGCIVVGLVVGILIGLATEHFTSHTEEPTQSIGRATAFGPGPVIIQGLGQGMYSTVIPLILIVAAVLGAFYLAGFYGTAITCVGMLSTLGVTMSTDAYGPVSDNAGGIAEMAELPEWVREYTDQLDALGNTTAATGKGFANGSAVLSALSLLIAFARIAEIEEVNLLRPVVVIGVLIGSLLPYVFGAMTMLSVNKAAQEMMFEVRRQFKANPKLLTDKHSRPDYKKCIEISCKSSLREMVLPGVLATFSPLVIGFIFGSHALVGLLVGAIASGYLQGVMMSNTGGAWDNAKKWIEAGEFKIKGVPQGKGTDCHKAAVCGDTVGDPFKDTSGPALNILIKLMTRFAFVCAPLFAEDWEFWWVGLILLGGSIVLVIILKFTILVEDDKAEDDDDDDEPSANSPDKISKMPSSKSSSSSSSERNFSDDAWNNHLEPAGSSLLIAAGVFILLSIATTSLCLAAHFTDDFQRIDEYNPKFLTLSQRYFDGVKDPFIIWDRNNNNTCSFLTMLREAGNLTAWQAAERAQGRPIITYPFCSFHIPYTAIWGAMASSLFGLAAVCFYAMNVMSKPRGTDEMHDIANKIHISALEFLNQEYTWLAPFVFLLFCFLLIAIDGQDNSWVPASSVSFLFGAFLSASCGYMGMHLATQGNCRTAAACFSSKDQGLEEGLAVAFRTGACMGIGVVSCGVLGLTLSYAIFGNVQSLGGFGFGASAVALFARVGGGIYTKAADVGADLCGKVDHSLAEDSPKNPATIADCVGDNVGDVAGMGADLFESYVGSIVAAAVLGAGEFGEKGVALPFYIAMIGLVVSVFGTLGIRVSKGANGKATLDQLLAAMRLNIIVSGLFIVAGCVILCVFLFRAERDELEDLFDTPWRQKEPGARLLGCIVVGLVVGILIGLATEHFTSHTEEPTQSIGRATAFGPGPVIIQGLGQGMYSTVIPLILIVAAVLGAFYLAGFYGTAITCVGMLSTLGVTMSTDAYGPVSDNAGGIAEMAELPEWVREYTDQLDALGNTTAATGKGFANGSAVLSALSLLIAFARIAEIEEVNLLRPVVVIGVLIGSLLPYVFGAMTMLSVNKAAQEMMFEVRRQFKANPKLLTDKHSRPDYKKCIEISCKSSLREMVLPGVLATFSPLVIGFIFGSHALVGLLVGAIASGYLQGVMMSNTGGAWDNAKKWIEAGEFKIKGVPQGKGTDCHKAAVCGDTVGDPFKDTSGPALNILIKLMTRFAFVCAPLFAEDWEFWWVGLILLGGSIVLVIILKFTILVEDDKAEDDDDEPSETSPDAVEG